MIFIGFECDICGREFNCTSGRFLSDGRRYCWRCRIKDMHEGNRRKSETLEEFISNISDERLKMLFGEKKVVKEETPVPIESRFELMIFD